MAELWNCKGCGRLVSVTWKTCPHCGEVFSASSDEGDSHGSAVDDYERQRHLDRDKTMGWLIIGGLVVFLVVLGVTLAALYPNLVKSQGGSYRASSGTYRGLSEETKKKMYYDMIATQDQNPYSNEWNEGVKQAAADYYDIPMSQVDDIIHEGATERWLTPPPP